VAVDDSRVVERLGFGRDRDRRAHTSNGSTFVARERAREDAANTRRAMNACA
jgi:hypothetical protein